MNTIPKKAILSYAHSHPESNKEWEFKIDVNSNEDIFLVLVVDCEKMDKNSGKFDQEYYDSLTRRYKSLSNIMRFISGHYGVITNITEDIEKFFDLKIKPWFSYKNYEYIDNIEEQIRNAVKESSQPNVEASFSGSGESPTLRLILYYFNGDYSNYIEELQTILGEKIDLKQYSIMTTKGGK